MMNKKKLVDVHQYMPVLREILGTGKEVSLTITGNSMSPFLVHERGEILISPPDGNWKKGDMAFYQRTNGQYVMHRIIGEKEGRYICLGDNTITLEYISPEQMIGMVSAFKRGEKRIEVCNRYYKLYCFIWVLVSPVRIFLFKGKNKLFRWIKRFIKDKK